jgi:hypothetical protein
VEGVRHRRPSVSVSNVDCDVISLGGVRVSGVTPGA